MIVSLDEAIGHLKLPDSHSRIDELQAFLDAVTDHVERDYGTLPSGPYTDDLAVVDDGSGVHRYWLHPTYTPVLTVTSATDENGIAYTTGFTISTSGQAIRHDSITHGQWTVAYTAGETAIPADLKLAALEDVRGLFQPAQVGPPAEFGAFGIESTDIGPTGRPVRMWPRVDAWLAMNRGPRLGRAS